MSTTRIIQISDCHLFAEASAKLKGLCTRECLAAVLARIRAEFADFDRLVITGDLAHDERLETYEALREMLGGWLPRVRIIPGNHDHRAAMRAVFPELVTVGGPVHWVTFSDTVSGWRLIGLDSQIPGELPGRIATEQLDWLATELHRSPSLPTIIFLHHPPMPVESAWLDRIGLQNPEVLAAVLETAPQVRAILTGHVHQEFEGQLGTTPVLAVPSTAVQFRPRTAELECDDRPPGFRVLELGAGELKHRVCRLEASIASLSVPS